ncbi:MAG TPA: MFS transporter [Bacillales bacterium]|nr:MFS transporter [Bacillales bacterium]
MKIFELHPTVQLRLGIQFFAALVSSSVLPFLAVYFAGRLGQTVVGLMLVTIVLSGITGGFAGGFYSDKIGRKKLMIAADFVVVLTYVAIAYVNSPWHDWPYVTFVLFIVATFAEGVMVPVAQAMIIDVSSPDNRKFIFRLTYWAMNLAVALGGIIGAYLFEAHHFALFLGIAAVSAASMLITIFWISETYVPRQVSEEKSAAGPSIFSTYLAVLKDSIFIKFVVSGILLLSLEQQLTNYLGVRYAQHIPTQDLFPGDAFRFQVDGLKMLGFLRTENTLIVVFFTVLITMLVKKFSDSWVFYVGAGMFTLGYFVLGISVSPWVLFAAMVIVSAGEVLYAPVKQAYLANIAPENRRSSYMALNNLTFYIAMIVAAVFITLGSWLPFGVIAGLFLLMGAVSIGLFRRIMPELEKRSALNESKPSAG